MKWRVAREQVMRVAVGREGDIQFETDENGNQRWFDFHHGEISELHPARDKKVRLCRVLSDENLAGELAVISYRPGRRIVLCAPSGCAGIESGYIKKGFRKNKGKQAADRYAIAVSANVHGGFEVPKLLDYDEANDCLVITRTEGVSPGTTEQDIGTWTRIGSGLAHFQKFKPGFDLSIFSWREELAVLDERARRFILVMTALPDEWQAGRERLQRAAMALPGSSLKLTHRDLHDRQFIVSGKIISLLDFDLLCLADEALDAGNLLAHMRLRSFQRNHSDPGSGLLSCQQAFLNALGRNQEPSFNHRLFFYQATTFYRLALLYALRPRWANLTDMLISEGARCLDKVDETGLES